MANNYHGVQRFKILRFIVLDDLSLARMRLKAWLYVFSYCFGAWEIIAFLQGYQIPELIIYTQIALCCKKYFTNQYDYIVSTKHDWYTKIGEEKLAYLRFCIEVYLAIGTVLWFKKSLEVERLKAKNQKLQINLRELRRTKRNYNRNVSK